MKHFRVSAFIAVVGLGLLSASCDDDVSTATQTNQQLLTALLTVDDVSFIPADWEENMRAVVDAPTAPFDGTLDPYLCTEAGLPKAITEPQVQLELTGGSVMEILLSSKDANALFDELDAAYKSCGTGASVAYAPLADVPAVGDASASYRSDLGVVTIARFGSHLMILKWWVGDFFDQGIEYYPQMVTTAAKRVTDL